jgi:hypothetical protein
VKIVATAKKSKNNPDTKVKRKEFKIYDSTHCEHCKEKDDCKEYANYKIKLAKGKGLGCVCKRNK